MLLLLKINKNKNPREASVGAGVGVFKIKFVAKKRKSCYFINIKTKNQIAAFQTLASQYPGQIQLLFL